jgi:hypothetical protein
MAPKNAPAAPEQTSDEDPGVSPPTTEEMVSILWKQAQVHGWDLTRQ